MDRTFHIENRQSLYKRLPKGSIALLFSGAAPRKTADEYYPFSPTAASFTSPAWKNRGSS